MLLTGWEDSNIVAWLVFLLHLGIAGEFSLVCRSMDGYRRGDG